MIKRTIASHWGFTPDLMERIVEEDVEAYNLPFGAMDHLLRDTAAGKPGTITNVGLGTFVDPRQDGAKANDSTTEDLVDLVTLDGEGVPLLPIGPHRCRDHPRHDRRRERQHHDGTGGPRVERAGDGTGGPQPGGTVIAQVERVTKTGTLDPRSVAVPSVLVDAVVEAPASHHPQTYAEAYNPAYSGEIKPPASDSPDDAPLSARKIIARRACNGALE